MLGPSSEAMTIAPMTIAALFRERPIAATIVDNTTRAKDIRDMVSVDTWSMLKRMAGMVTYPPTTSSLGSLASRWAAPRPGTRVHWRSGCPQPCRTLRCRLTVRTGLPWGPLAEVLPRS